MKIKNQAFALLCAISLTLSACNTTNNVPNTTKTEEVNPTTQDFSEFLDTLFIEELENDYNTFHTYVQDEKSFNIDRSKIEVSLGDFSVAVDEEEEKRDQTNLETLQSFDYDTLSDTQKDIYDQLVYTYNLNKNISDEKYNYLGSIWSSTSSASTSLYNLFMEYTFHCEQDIDDCIGLINDVPRYVDQVIQYTKEQADAGLLMISYDKSVEGINDILNSQKDNNVLNALVKAMDTLELEDAQKEEYKKKIKEALDTSFYPAYESMLKGLESVKEKNKKHKGLSSLKNGKDYYNLLISYYTGTKDSPEDMRTKLNTIINDAMSTIYTTYQDTEPKTGFKSTEEIMTFLEEHYKDEFPEIKIPNYNVEALSKEQEEENVLAYFVIPAIDYTGTEKIRYNSHSSSASMDNLNFYQTLAHEGIPGHMYTYEYFREHYQYNIQYVLSNLGLSEGYATYVESRSLHFLKLDKDALKFENAYMALNNAYTCLMDISVNYDGLSYSEFQKEYSALFGNDLEDIYNLLCESPGIFMAYYYGYFTILDLRQDAKGALGDKFNDIQFNDALLSAGEVNFEIVKRHIDQYIDANKQ